MPQPPKILNQFESIVQILSDLRGPNGCPWDQKQTHQSLTPYAIEEVHEMAEAIESGSDQHMAEELGDVLFQVVLHSQIAKERGAFDVYDVIRGISEKIIRRHPHVYSGVTVTGTQEVIDNWEAIKRAEKKAKPPTSALDVPPSLPALQRAHKIGEKTEKYKFDWKEPTAVLKQLKAEIAELEHAMASNQPEEIRHELGDVLFSAAQLSRHLDVEPESALRDCNRRFTGRFEKMLKMVGGLESFVTLSSEEKELLWQAVKKDED